MQNQEHDARSAQTPGPPSRIRHTPSAIGGGSPATHGQTSGGGGGDPDAVPVVQPEGPTRTNKITAFGKVRRHEEEWTRTPNTTGSGAIHVKTFHAKLTDDALRYMDQMINEWLDAHPQYEVKFVNSTVGTLTGKLKEPHIICQVWV